MRLGKAGRAAVRSGGQGGCGAGRRARLRRGEADKGAAARGGGQGCGGRRAGLRCGAVDRGAAARGVGGMHADNHLIRRR